CSKFICVILTLGSLSIAAHEIPECIRMVDLLEQRYSYIEREARKGATIIPEYELRDICRSSKYVESFGLSTNIQASVEESRFWGTRSFSVFPRNQYNLLTANKSMLLSMREGEQRILGDITVVCTGERPVKSEHIYFVDYSRTATSLIVPQNLRQLYMQYATERKLTVTTLIFQLHDKYYTYFNNSNSGGKLIITYPNRTLEIELLPQSLDLSQSS
ncbi:MAG: hypothetical protein IJ956_08580, partial [Akkermansia sp.]|nr:hypothetical protein [Akkermansia sp.]